ncbi:hypothetical protein Fmac_026947 [Flemingia macrophylla]|uniref:Uncharacterized protein n=1 Tax=Flemingia macrophylla TaxID=520843 RepID=A0ABD1LGK0_9FABA
MEELKLRYLKSFLERTHKGLRDCIEYIKKSEEIIRSSYWETIELRGDNFVRMVLTDACFIIEYFIRSLEWTQEDPLLSKPWLRCDVKLDLILLENQLPWFVLEELFNLTEPDCSNGEVSSFFDVAFHYFRANFLQSILPGVDSTNFTINYFHKHYKQYIMKPDQVGMQLQNLTDLLRIFYLPPNRLPKREKETVKHLYSASQLVEAGVKLHVDHDKSAPELQFGKGVLTIPEFEKTELLLRESFPQIQGVPVEPAHSNFGCHSRQCPALLLTSNLFSSASNRLLRKVGVPAKILRHSSQDTSGREGSAIGQNVPFAGVVRCIYSTRVRPIRYGSPCSLVGS